MLILSIKLVTVTLEGRAMTTNLTIRPVVERLVGVVPDVERVVLEPIIEEIEDLKRQRNAVVLAHNYSSATPWCSPTTT
jgi:hypothetical protein